MASSKRLSSPTAALLVTVLASVLLATAVTVFADEGVADMWTIEEETDQYMAHAANVQRAAFPGVGGRAAPTVFPFDCDVRGSIQTIYADCASKTSDNLCIGRTWYIYGDDGSVEAVSGTTGVDICKYTTCKDMVCRRNDTQTSIMQTFSEQQMTPNGCSCLDVNTGVNSWDGMYYTEDNPNYPWDNDVNCSHVLCDNATFPEGGTAVYEDGQCWCWYPKGIQKVIRVLQMGTVTQSTRTPNNVTAQPNVTTSTPTKGPASPLPSLGPTYTEMLALAVTADLCPSFLQGLDANTFAQNIDKFCCTSFVSIDYTWEECGNAVFQNMPRGKSYCKSSIPSFEFCCELEHMQRDMFVYRGDSCVIREAAGLAVTRAMASLSLLAAVFTALLASVY